MPGTIVKVNVETGQNVAEGEKLLILEAMKMENPVVSTESGIIKNIGNYSAPLNKIILS